MKEWLILAFIFFIGSLAGWLLELIFRRFFSKANPSRKWINPGFLVGPYLPLYGFSLCVVYLLAHINVSFIHGVYLRKTVLFLLMALSVTLIEYFAGLIFVIASVTDFFDGFIARNWDQMTKLGGILDPLADKMLVLAGFLGLLIIDRASAWAVFLILSREFFITGLNFEYKAVWVLLFKYWVAASSFPNKMVLASAKVIPFTASTKMGVASFTASSAALLSAFIPSSANFPKPISLNPLSTFFNSSLPS